MYHHVTYLVVGSGSNGERVSQITPYRVYLTEASFSPGKVRSMPFPSSQDKKVIDDVKQSTSTWRFAKPKANAIARYVSYTFIISCYCIIQGLPATSVVPRREDGVGEVCPFSRHMMLPGASPLAACEQPFLVMII